MNHEKIAQAATYIWKNLRERGSYGERINTVVKPSRGFTRDDLSAGIGWLAREGKLFFVNDGRGTTIKIEDDILVGDTRTGRRSH